MWSGVKVSTIQKLHKRQSSQVDLDCMEGGAVPSILQIYTSRFSVVSAGVHIIFQKRSKYFCDIWIGGRGGSGGPNIT